LEGQKVLFVGGQGPVSAPAARALAPGNDVFVMARFSNPESRARLEAQGMTCIVHDLFHPVDDLPNDFDYVYHTALPMYTVTEPLGMWPDSYDKYADATGRLMAHLRPSKGFLFGSTISLYDPPARPWGENAPKAPGDTPVAENHSYGIHTHNAYAFTKACNEAIVSYLSRSLEIPTTIIRIGSASGPDGGPMRWRLDDMVEGKPVKVHPDKPTYMRPLFEPDAAKLGIAALEAGRVPPLVVNWCGDDIVTVARSRHHAAHRGARVRRRAVAGRVPGSGRGLLSPTHQIIKLTGGRYTLSEVGRRGGVRGGRAADRSGVRSHHHGWCYLERKTH
jgi:UDP-glucuronate 4-epimerase